MTWTIRVHRNGEWTEKRVTVDAGTAEWMNVQLIAEPRQLILQVNQKERLRVAHDAYREPFHLCFGSRQPRVGGAEVVSHFREVYVSDRPYPWPGEQFAQGPEDVHAEDNAVVGYLLDATPQSPRSSEGDMILTKEGHLLAVYSYYYDGKGHDDSPARLVASISKDGGRTWSPHWTVADRDKGSQGNVMSASLLRAANGDLLLAYYDRTPEMPAKGMVLRRSANDGKTWNERIVITPGNGNRHVANNACLTRLASGRIVLATREYVGGVRWPYACYSDDGGRTWKAGPSRSRSGNHAAAEARPERQRAEYLRVGGRASVNDGCDRSRAASSSRGPAMREGRGRSQSCHPCGASVRPPSCGASPVRKTFLPSGPTATAAVPRLFRRSAVTAERPGRILSRSNRAAITAIVT